MHDSDKHAGPRPAAVRAAASHFFSSQVVKRSVVTVATVLEGATRASAATYTVTSALDDSSAGTLRAQVALANYSPGLSSTIQFDAAQSGNTIALTQGPIVVKKSMTIVGLGSANLAIDGGNASRIFTVGGYSEFQLGLSGITLKNGKAAKGGAMYAVSNAGLDLQDVVLSGNSAPGGNGGAIYVRGNPAGTLPTISLHDVSITNNTAVSAAGIYAKDVATLTLVDSTISGNTASSAGGAYFKSVTDLGLTNTQVTGNTATIGNAGGLAIYSPSSASSFQITDSLISGNTTALSGGGIWIRNATGTITGTRVLDNTTDIYNGAYGGGIYINDPRPVPTAILTLRYATISNNKALFGGGGIYVMRAKSVDVAYSLIDGNQGLDTGNNHLGGGIAIRNVTNNSTISNSTIYGNYSGLNGGGIAFPFGTAASNMTSIVSSTVFGNATKNALGNGIFSAGGTPKITNSIVAKNLNKTSVASSQDLQGTFSVNFSDIMKWGSATIAGSDNLADGTDPNLGALAANGGPTQSMAPNPGSPVVNTGDTSIVSGTDQRSLPRVVNGRVDMGAVEAKASKTLLISSLNPSSAGQSVTFSATVSGQAPTGNVTFNDGGSPICSPVTLAGGVAACATSALTPGSHTMTAVYSGDVNNNTSTSPGLNQTVNPALAASTTALSSSLNPSQFGDSVTFTATVSGQSPSGSVTFKDGSTPICTAVTLNNASAGCAAATLVVGGHSITATYSGDSGNTGSVSNTVSQTINKASSAIALSSSVNPSSVGQSVKFSATVSGQLPSGTVTFTDGATTICPPVTLSSGKAACTTSALAAGTHAIAADYAGDGNNTAASTGLSQTVKAASSTQISTNCMTTFVEQQTFTMAATVTGANPSGNVAFKYGAGTVLCPAVPLNAATAACTTSSLTGGATQFVYDMYAAYGGDVSNASSNSGVLTITVLAAVDVPFRNGFEPTSASCPQE